MKTTAKKTPRVSKKQKILIGLAGIVVMLASWWAYISFMPHPLGEKMEYLGKKDYGCLYSLCDADLSSVYYYGTDMTPEEVVGYFKGATLEQPAKKESLSETLLHMKNTTNSRSFFVSHYSEKPDQLPFKSKTQFIVSIPSFNYETARKALLK